LTDIDPLIAFKRTFPTEVGPNDLPPPNWQVVLVNAVRALVEEVLDD
jgi:hypothetical protein